MLVCETTFSVTVNSVILCVLVQVALICVIWLVCFPPIE